MPPGDTTEFHSLFEGEVYKRELAVGEVRHGKGSERGLQRNGVALLPYAWRLYRDDHTDPAC